MHQKLHDEEEGMEGVRLVSKKTTSATAFVILRDPSPSIGATGRSSMFRIALLYMPPVTDVIVGSWIPFAPLTYMYYAGCLPDTDHNSDLSTQSGRYSSIKAAHR
jgi:hypothetical protein